MKPCEYPLDDGSTCNEPSSWETDDLADVHFLCESHCTEALRWDDFNAEPAS